MATEHNGRLGDGRKVAGNGPSSASQPGRRNLPTF
jgi:hypothetical protein